MKWAWLGINGKTLHCDWPRGPRHPQHGSPQERIFQGPQKGILGLFRRAAMETERIRLLNSLSGLSEDPSAETDEGWRTTSTDHYHNSALLATGHLPALRDPTHGMGCGLESWECSATSTHSFIALHNQSVSPMESADWRWPERSHTITESWTCPRGRNTAPFLVMDWSRLHWERMRLQNIYSTSITWLHGRTGQRKFLIKGRR